MASLLAPARVGAQESAGEVHDEYAELLKEETALRDNQKAAALKATDMAAQVASLDTQIIEVEAQLVGAEADLAANEAAAADAGVRLAETEAKLEFERGRLRDQSVQAYIGGGASPVPDFAAALESAAAIDDIATSRVYAAVVVDDRKHVIARFAQAKIEVEDLRNQVEVARQSSEAARDEVASHAADLDSQRSARLAAQEQSQAASAEAARLADEIEVRRRDAEMRYAELTLQSDSISMRLAGRQKDQTPPASTFGIFLNPIKNGPIVSPYGMRMHPILGYQKMHAGVDIDGHMGDPMRASEAGVVVIAAVQGGYGNAVVIDHGNTLATLYGHMSQLDVKEGDIVARGQVIGLVGSTGQSTGPHCHWEVRVLGVPVDGTPYLDTTVEP